MQGKCRRSSQRTKERVGEREKNFALLAPSSFRSLSRLFLAFFAFIDGLCSHPTHSRDNCSVSLRVCRLSTLLTLFLLVLPHCSQRSRAAAERVRRRLRKLREPRSSSRVVHAAAALQFEKTVSERREKRLDQTRATPRDAVSAEGRALDVPRHPDVGHEPVRGVESETERRKVRYRKLAKEARRQSRRSSERAAALHSVDRPCLRVVW